MKILSMKDKEIIVFTDGSSKGNPGPGGFGVVAIYPNAFGEPQVDELGGRENETTNNRMELKAVIEAIKNFINYYPNLSEYSFSFYIDSGYVVKGIREWLPGWIRKNWITTTKEEVKNRDLWEELSDLLSKGDGKGSINLTLNLIPGHSGILGNERCDVIATSFADNKPTSLYTGSLAGYDADKESDKSILNISTVDADVIKKQKTKDRKSSSSSKPAFSYISLVDGKLSIDKTWAECEKKVKGKSGARFKKSISSEDEKEIIQIFLKKA